jgi:hypothetical protein
MSIFIYIYRGAFLLLSLLIPSKRQITLERWKRTKTHRLIYEIGGGVIGIIVLFAFVWVIIDSSMGHNPWQR